MSPTSLYLPDEGFDLPQSPTVFRSVGFGIGIEPEVGDVGNVIEGASGL